MARDYRSKMLRVRLLPALLLFIPLGASATIYQWTDETGHIVLGNQVPETARNVRAVMKEDAAPANSNRELEERIARLERQVQAMQVTPAAAPYPAPVPPMPADYYGGAAYSPAMYPPPAYYPYSPYYPYGYAYPFGVVRVVRPARAFAGSPRFASRPFTSFHHAGFHRR
jgi:Domain of unknown function (DUF4124)